MRIDVISRSRGEAQAAREAGLPKTYIEIAGRPDELDEPGKLIRAAARAITTGRAAGRRPSITATKAIALLWAASLRAKTLRQWSASGEYDPRADLLELDALARTKLGPARGQDHPVTQLREGVAETLRILDGPAS